MSDRERQRLQAENFIKMQKQRLGMFEDSHTLDANSWVPNQFGGEIVDECRYGLDHNILEGKKWSTPAIHSVEYGDTDYENSKYRKINRGGKK